MYTMVTKTVLFSYNNNNFLSIQRRHNLL